MKVKLGDIFGDLHWHFYISIALTLFHGDVGLGGEFVETVVVLREKTTASEN